MQTQLSDFGRCCRDPQYVPQVYSIDQCQNCLATRTPDNHDH